MQRTDDPIWIEGDGIVLREWLTSDVPSLVTLYDTSEMDRRTPVASPFTEREARDYVASAHQLRREVGSLQLAITTTGGEAIGEVLAFPAAEDGVVELAFAVAASHMGQGLARRAVSVVLTNLAKMDVVRAQLLIADDNRPSQRVAKDAGFVLTDQPVVERHRKGMILRLATWDRALGSALPESDYSDADVVEPQEAS